MPFIDRHTVCSPLSLTFSALLGCSALHTQAADWQDAYGTWSKSHLPGERAEFQVPKADADGDRLTNFLEFALGTDALQFTKATDYQSFEFISVNNRRLVDFTYQRSRDAANLGLRYRVEVSETLNQWRPANLITNLTEKAIVADDGLSERFTVRLNESKPANGQLFFRLKIAEVPTASVAATWEPTELLEALDGQNGFTIRGAKEDDVLGGSVSNAGDINGDGIGDVVVGARGAGDEVNGNFSGKAYVVFGSNNPPAVIGVETLDGTNGFAIAGAFRDDRLGSCSAAGDVNGDGIDDVLVASHLADSPEKNTGSAYVIYGSAGGFPALIDTANLNGLGFAIHGVSEWDRTGVSLADAGDLNGDNFADIMIGADLADPKEARSGKAYVVFGTDTGFPSDLYLDDLNGHDGFTLVGTKLDHFVGRDLAGIGDINGDGLSEIIIGSGDRRKPSDTITEQDFYVVYGSANLFPSRIELDDLDGVNGFRVRIQTRANEYTSASVAGNGDLNGDGLSDIIIGNEQGGSGSQKAAGEIHVVFGNADGFPAIFHTADVDGSNGTLFEGIQDADNAGSDIDMVGDINGDGIGDLLIGAYGGNGVSDDEDFKDAGEAYLIFGRNAFLASHKIEDLLANNTAILLAGVNDDDFTGRAVSRAGDVNGDGIADLIIGSHRANRDPDDDGNFEEDNNGEAYVIFGRQG